MISLPVCPHCSTVFRYKDIRKLFFAKNCICYGCREQFRVSRKKVWILALITVIVTVILNVAELIFLKNTTFMFLMITNITVLLIAIFIAPYFIEFIKTEK